MDIANEIAQEVRVGVVECAKPWMPDLEDWKECNFIALAGGTDHVKVEKDHMIVKESIRNVKQREMVEAFTNDLCPPRLAALVALENDVLPQVLLSIAHRQQMEGESEDPLDPLSEEAIPRLRAYIFGLINDLVDEGEVPDQANGEVVSKFLVPSGLFDWSQTEIGTVPGKITILGEECTF